MVMGGASGMVGGVVTVECRREEMGGEALGADLQRDPMTGCWHEARGHQGAHYEGHQQNAGDNLAMPLGAERWVHELRDFLCAYGRL
jgi:hypothetical protein